MPKKIREIKDNSWTLEYNESDYSVDDFITDHSDAFQNQYQELAPTQKEQEQQLADLNTKLCNHCLISCHFQYCDECNFMFNLLSRILYSITKLLEPEEKEELLAKNMLFQEPNQTTEIEQYFIDNDKRICPERVHKTNAGFDLRYSGQSPIVIAPHSLVKIDLKIVLEIPVNTIVQIAFRSSLTKKEIDIKGKIINAGYTKNIILMLQNNSDKSYKIKSHEKIAQAIFLPLVKILQLALITTQEKLSLTA
ncbi:hypothetical protein G9A89_009709 [Geosiphon pyriformis]|nr:hypothetical protein G9A89_009709 [Geosiphon pyriformis]